MSNELFYYERLKRIMRYQTPEQLRRTSGKQYGLPYEEALEYAYENVLQEAANAVKGKRKPAFIPVAERTKK